MARLEIIIIISQLKYRLTYIIQIAASFRFSILVLILTKTSTEVGTKYDLKLGLLNGWSKWILVFSIVFLLQIPQDRHLIRPYLKMSIFHFDIGGITKPQILKNWTGHGQKAAALWPNTTYTKFGHIPSKNGTWTCPNMYIRACNVHVVPIIVLRMFSYPKFWCLTFFYDKNWGS